MRFMAIEINDAGTVAAKDGVVSAESPGFALLEPRGPVVGRAAQRQWRLKPRLVNTRFWDLLSNEPLSRGAGGAASHADLALLHLRGLWAGSGDGVDAAVLAVPAHFSREQLGLLLGIAEALEMPVRGLVDSALAASRPAPATRSLVHVEMYLHRTVLTGIEQGEAVRRTFVRDVSDCGLAGLQESWMKLVGDLFVRHTRFDPLHRAETEQALYDCVPGWLASMEEQEALDIEMVASDGSEHSVRLSRTRMADAVTAPYGRLVSALGELSSGEAVTVELSHRVARLPGLVEALRGAGVEAPVSLEPGAAALGAERLAGYLATSRSANVLTVDLPREIHGGPRASAQGMGDTPTHVVHRGLVYALGERPFRLGRRVPPGEAGIAIDGVAHGVSEAHCSIHRQGARAWVEDHSTQGTFVNGSRVEGTASIVVGDKIVLGEGGEALDLVRLAKPT